MKRRKLVRYATAGLVSTLGLGLASSLKTVQAQSAPSVTVKWLGHTSFLFTGDGRKVLVNPFRPIGCTAGYRQPVVETDLILISSRLFDEGYVEGFPPQVSLLSEPGVYDLNGLRVEGILTDHDREGGRRFGNNVVWQWQQGGLTLVHLGGIAAPIELEQQILLGQPDVLFVPVGGGPKAYDADEAVAAIRALSPRIVIPTQYRTQAADPETCDIEELDTFLSKMPGVPVERFSGDTITLSPGSLPGNGMKILVPSYSF